jgi:hypothetical protein
LLLLFSSKSTQSRSCYIKLITLETQCCLWHSNQATC